MGSTPKGLATLAWRGSTDVSKMWADYGAGATVHWSRGSVRGTYDRYRRAYYAAKLMAMHDAFQFNFLQKPDLLPPPSDLDDEIPL